VPPAMRSDGRSPSSRDAITLRNPERVPCLPRPSEPFRPARLVSVARVERASSGSRNRRLSIKPSRWWQRRESNPRRRAYEARVRACARCRTPGRTRTSRPCVRSAGRIPIAGGSCVACRIRTGVSALRGRRPRPSGRMRPGSSCGCCPRASALKERRPSSVGLTSQMEKRRRAEESNPWGS
jgi:hypothetical protein